MSRNFFFLINVTLLSVRLSIYITSLTGLYSPRASFGMSSIQAHLTWYENSILQAMVGLDSNHFCDTLDVRGSVRL